MSCLPVFLALGASAHTVQTVLLRDVLALSNGSAPAVSLGVASWMLAVAIGGWLGDVWERERLGKHHSIDVGFWVLSCLPFVSIACACIPRMMRVIIPVEPGNSLPFMWLAVLAAGVCIVPGLCHGFAFPLLLRANQDSKGAGFVVDGHGGHAYAFDTFGAAVSGVLLSFVFLRLAAGIQLAVWVSMTPLPAYLWQVRHTAGAADRLRRNRIPLLLSLSVLISFTILGGRVQQRLYAWYWRHAPRSPMQLVGIAHSAYGVSELVAYSDQTSVYMSGRLHFTLPPDPARHAMADTMMLQRPVGARVLLVNGVLSSALVRVLKHGPQKVDCLEQPPDIRALCEPYMSRSHREALDCASVRVIYADPLSHLQQSSTTYDVVMVLLPEPSTTGTARYCSVEFLRAVSARLAPGGVLGLGPISGCGAYATKGFLARNSTLYHTAWQAWKRKVAVSGGDPWLITWEAASAAPGLDFARLYQRAVIRGTPNYDPSVLTDEFSVERNRHELSTGTVYNPLQTSDGQQVATQVSSLMTPLAAGLTMHAWADVGADRLRGILRSADDPTWVWYLPAIALCLLVAVIPPFGERTGRTARLSVYLAGFWAGLMQFSVMIVFQSYLGTLYQHVALLIGAHMLGMGLASRAAATYPLPVPLVRAVYLLGVPALFLLPLASVCPRPLLLPSVAVLSLIVGSVPGLAFARGATTMTSQSSGGLGSLYAWDLIGGLLGYVVGALALLPAGGLLPSPAISVVPIVLAFLTRKPAWRSAET
jgi:predicted membrane-bound spermidine synthase